MSDRNLRRRAEEMVKVLLARDPDFLASLVVVGEVRIATDLSLASSSAPDEKTGESSIPG